MTWVFVFINRVLLISPKKKKQGGAEFNLVKLNAILPSIMGFNLHKSQEKKMGLDKMIEQE